MNALLVDDDPQLRRAVSWILRDAGFTRIIEADDGEAALLRLRDGAPDLVITDCQMPKMDGLALARALRVRGVDAPIILLSSLDHPEVDAAALRAGIAACVRKPLRAAALADAIERCLPIGAATAGQPAAWS